MTDLSQCLERAQAFGFEHAGNLQVSTLEFLPEVRAMCAADKCHSFGRNWMCPPACGSLDDSRRRAQGFSAGLLVQTVGKLEDDFDYESMQEAGRVHSRRFHGLIDELRVEFPKLLAMGAGACTLCEVCSCPAQPCRFPDRAITSMEAFGLFVSRVCERNGLAYNRGPLTVTYTSCVLLE